MKKLLVPTIACAAFGVAGVAHGDVLFFLDEAEFQAALEQAGKIKKGFEDFPWLAAPNNVTSLHGPVDVNASLPGWFEVGSIIDNLQFQSNVGGSNSTQTGINPGNGIALFTQDFLGLPANGLVASYFVDSFDIISGAPGGDNHTAMGMTMTSIVGGPTVRVDVYDKNNVPIGSLASAPAGMGGGFLGILATGADTIGRVNLFDPGGGAEGLFNIGVYIPAPGSLALLGLAGLVGTRRRRQ